MALYAVGDIQGCYDPLARLLDRVDFDPHNDTLLCVGDLVNRGPKSLKTLRFLMGLGDSCETVLGNHDIHLLAMMYGVREHRHHDTLLPILDAPDAQEIANWLRNKPLLKVSNKHSYVLCHAGIYPWWTLEQAKTHALDVAKQFCKEEKCVKLLKRIYSNKPLRWSDDLGKTARRRFTINAFTRMRFVSANQRLNFYESGYAGKVSKTRIPWFELPNPSLANYRVIFGHWSALGLLVRPNLLALDSGCVWGRELSLAKLPSNPLKGVTIYQQTAK